MDRTEDQNGMGFVCDDAPLEGTHSGILDAPIRRAKAFAEAYRQIGCVPTQDTPDLPDEVEEQPALAIVLTTRSGILSLKTRQAIQEEFDTPNVQHYMMPGLEPDEVEALGIQLVEWLDQFFDQTRSQTL